jgi:hypothetical protein
MFMFNTLYQFSCHIVTVLGLPCLCMLTTPSFNLSSRVVCILNIKPRQGFKFEVLTFKSSWMLHYIEWYMFTSLLKNHSSLKISVTSYQSTPCLFHDCWYRHKRRITYLLLLACLNTQINEKNFLNNFWLVMKYGSFCTTLKLSGNHHIENPLPHK